MIFMQINCYCCCSIATVQITNRPYSGTVQYTSTIFWQMSTSRRSKKQLQL